MKQALEKDKKKRKNYYKNEKKRVCLKSLSSNRNLPDFLRWKSSFALSAFSKTVSPLRIKNRCILTGRSRSILSSYRLSRLAFQRLAKEGKIVGLRKASW